MIIVLCFTNLLKKETEKKTEAQMYGFYYIVHTTQVIALFGI